MKKSDMPNADILIVGDNLGNLEALSVVLSKNGYQVRVKRGGSSALASAREKPPHLILLDIMMPDMSGFDVCEQLKACEQTRDVPVIFISALDHVTDKVRCFEFGGVDYVTKPFQPQEVLARVRTHLCLSNTQERLQKKNARLWQEIVEKKETIEKLRISEQKYRELVENANSIILRVDPDWNITFVNEFAQNFFGYAEADLMGQNVVGTIVPWSESTGRDLAALIDDIAHHPENYRYNENENMCQNGNRVWIAWTNKVITDEQGNVAEILCIGNDITEKKQAEDALKSAEIALREREELLNMFVKHTPVPVAMCDRQMRYIAHSDQWVRDYGLNEENLIGKCHYDVFEEIPEHWKAQHRRCFAGEVIKRKEEIFPRADGTTDWIKREIFPWKDKSGQIGGLIMFTKLITKRKQVEIALRESEARYRSLFQNNHLAMLLIDPETARIVDSNPAASLFYGYTEEEIRQKKITDINILSKEQVLREMEQAKSEQRKHFLFRHRLANREIRDVEVYSSPILIKGKHLLFSFIHDITEMKQAQAAQSRLAAIMESSEDAIIGKSLDGTIFAWNAGAENIYGHTREKAIGNHASIIFPPERGEEIPQILGRVCAGEHVRCDESLFVPNRKHGNKGKEACEEIHVSLTMSPIRDASGKITGVSTIARDYTERKQAEDALRESEDRFRAIFRNAGIGIALADMKGRLIQINPAFQKMLGHAEESLLGTTFAELTHPDDFDKNMNAYSELIQGKTEYYQIEKRYFRKNREALWANVIVSLIRDASGNPRFSVGMIEDITGRRQMQKELEDARKKAEAANLAKSEFLANMSHEIRTPMNAILGFSEILTNLVHDSEQKSYLKNIRSSGKSLLSLIDDILDLSKIEAGKLEIQPGPVSISSISDEIGQLFQYKCQEKEIKFISDISRDVPDELFLDEVRIRQILVNLVGNAIKFTNEGYVKIRVRGKREEPSSAPSPLAPHPLFNLIIEVEDTGIGIPEAQQGVIFETFRQQDGQMTKKYGGSGLGLTITKRLTEMMNGNISVESETDRGSRFRIVLYRVKVVEKSDIKEIPSEKDNDRVEFRPATLLIVDDMDFNRILVKGLLNDGPFSFVEARDGEQALEMLGLADTQEGLPNKEERPDLILMDLRMPGKNGYEVAEIIKNNDELKNIPVIALTASAMKETEEKVRYLCDGYIRKPFDARELLSELKKHLPYAVLPGSSRTDGNMDPCQRQMPVSEKPLSPQAGARMSDLIQILENEFVPKWEDVRETLIFDEVKAFVRQTDAYGMEYGCASLQHWGDIVTHQMQNFDMESLENTFGKFPDIIKKVGSSK